MQYCIVSIISRLLLLNFAVEFDGCEVKHHFVSRLEWIDSANGERKYVRVYNTAAWKWSNVATTLGLEPGEIQSIRQNYFSDEQRVSDVFRHWFDNANNLPNKKRYPKKWSGLIRLLSDSDLGQLSEEVRTALSAASSNVRGNLPPQQCACVYTYVVSFQKSCAVFSSFMCLLSCSFFYGARILFLCCVRSGFDKLSNDVPYTLPPKKSDTL